jgi:hypothetical protein
MLLFVRLRYLNSLASCATLGTLLAFNDPDFLASGGTGLAADTRHVLYPNMCKSPFVLTLAASVANTYAVAAEISATADLGESRERAGDVVAAILVHVLVTVCHVGAIVGGVVVERKVHFGCQ